MTVGYKGSDLAKYVIEKGVTSILNTEGKGNAWWLYNSLLKNIDKPICVFTCDNVIDTNFDKLFKEYQNLKNPHCMLIPTKPIKGLEGDYIFTDESSNVVELSRNKKSNI